ncbi:hypothetical protein CHS0354_013015 [Potamilus streckersoni]|uniref:Uncharacterized protein n=1 Tax=Potamilus streckersoni TaxID=2493646 RepID=A0AAE0SYL7_9BIVA|nr:hypothetical protein CHS0354_013015 [Potamilus streckersoni]
MRNIHFLKFRLSAESMSHTRGVTPTVDEPSQATTLMTNGSITQSSEQSGKTRPMQGAIPPSLDVEDAKLPESVNDVNVDGVFTLEVVRIWPLRAFSSRSFVEFMRIESVRVIMAVVIAPKVDKLMTHCPVGVGIVTASSIQIGTTAVMLDNQGVKTMAGIMQLLMGMWEIR